MSIDHQEMTLNPALTHSGENKRKDGLQTGFALKKQNAKTYTYKAPFLARVHSALQLYTSTKHDAQALKKKKKIHIEEIKT